MAFPTIRRSAAIVWRSLRSMRTALVLLLLLALASVAGSLVPQVGVADARIAQTFRDHPLRAELYARFGLFDVYGSTWFTLIYVLLLVSLVTCLVPRTRATFRAIRTRPQPSGDLDAMRHYAEVAVAAEPAAAIAGVRRLLRRRRWLRMNPADGAPAIAADKGVLREAGSLVFHWAFLVLLLGVVWGRGTGFTGKAVIVEGQTWTEAHANFDGSLREGSFFGEDHAGATVTVESFVASYRVTGQPKDFVTTAVVARADGSDRRRVDIRVNHPARVGHVKFLQFGYGWAPVLRVEQDGRAIFDGPVVCRQDAPPAGVSPLQLPWDCVLKLTSLRPQVGVAFRLWPDSRALYAILGSGQPMPMLMVFDPVLTWTAFEGDLRADRVQAITSLDTAAMRPIGDGALGAGRTVTIRPGLTVSFPDLRRYTVLQVTRDRGTGVVLAAAILILGGLLLSLYGSRRRVFVTAEPAGAGSVLRVGGFAVQRPDEFEREFAALVADLREPVGR